MEIGRRDVLRAGMIGSVGLWLAACGEPRGDEVAGDAAARTPSLPRDPALDGSLVMPAEDDRHAATWMCFPGRRAIWGRDLAAVQATIAEIGLVVARFETVRMLARPDDVARAQELVGSDLDVIEAPVDDLWARDTLPLFLVSESGDLAAARVRFNGWGGKQVHDGDVRLAGLVADMVEIDLLDTGLVGEGGGVETDGEGTLLASRSSWVNDNRNPGLDDEAIAGALTAGLGARRLLWVDGVAGEDITDGHIDTLARFADSTTIVRESTSYVEPGEVWYELALATAESLERFRTLEGDRYELVELEQPTTTRRRNPDFLASYVNYYLCNGAVLIPEFGDARADGRASERIGALYPDREVVAIDIDPVAAGGGGIHCATQQQPAI